mmetsp:Transcript_26822/g.62108  ORF Transcript_26822/g.62108 Transcript_26822/m.62108 type:complete len:280 (-) Transcript_26822:207-1046(-)
MPRTFARRGRTASAFDEDLEPWEPLSPGPEASPTASRPARKTLGDCWGAAPDLIGGEVPGGPVGGWQGVVSCGSDSGIDSVAEDDDEGAYADDVALSQAFRALLGVSSPPVGGGARGVGRAAGVAPTSGCAMCGGDDDAASLVDGCSASHDAWSVVSAGIDSRRPSLLELPSPAQQRKRGDALANDEELVKFLSPPPLGAGYLAALISNAASVVEDHADSKLLGEGVVGTAGSGSRFMRPGVFTASERNAKEDVHEFVWECEEHPRGWSGRKVRWGNRR